MSDLKWFIAGRKTSWIGPYEMRERLALVCVLIFILVMGIWQLPVSLHLYNQHQAIFEALGSSGQERFWAENYRQLKEEKVIKANYLKSLEEKLYFSDELQRFLQDFRQISQSTRVELTGFNFGTVNKKENYTVQAMDVTVCGTYNGIMTFLQMVNNEMSCQKFDFVLSPLMDNLQCSLKLEITLKPGKRGG